MEIRDKIVDFNKYCKDCEYFELDEAYDPCNECLNNPSNQNSQRPVNFKKKEVKEKKKNGNKQRLQSKINENRNSR